MSERNEESVEQAAQRKHEMRMTRWIIIGGTLGLCSIMGSWTRFSSSGATAGVPAG